ncbi:MAG TPA: hypothetical protein VFT42_11595 [Solirubrobacteraceae bacterium]|nr:hypothetical protein [Solirubrobacteraceae bacterium]
MAGHGRRPLTIAALATAAVLALAAPVDATQPATPGAASATLQIKPGGGPARAGEQQTLIAQVSAPSGNGVDGAEVDFEVTQGPGDVDGDTPQTPDMTCVTAGGGKNQPSTCTVSYGEPANQGGTDAVLAWIDVDGDDSTVEADPTEGVNHSAPGDGPCVPGSKGAGSIPEPDGTDCVEKRWQGRVPTSVGLAPRAGAGQPGSTAELTASVLDQFGAPFGVLGSSATVSFELLAGSAHDPGDGSDFTTPDLGTCVTGPAGGCSIPFSEPTAGTDVVCAYVSGLTAGCANAPDATPPADGAAVVTYTWTAPPTTGQVTPPPPPPAATPPPPEPVPAQPPAPSGKPHRHDPAPAPHQDQAPPREAAPAPSAPPVPRQAIDAVHSAAAPAAAPARHRHARGHHRRRHRAAVLVRVPGSRAPGLGGPGATRRREPLPTTPRRVRRPTRHAAPTTLALLSRAALATANRFSFPIGLALIVLLFLALQGRIDRRDPKLRLAPVDSKHDLLTFE